MENAQEQNWYFTFCGVHEQSNCYVKIFGTFESSREEMFRGFGEKWGFQYSSPDDAGVYRYNLQEILI